MKEFRNLTTWASGAACVAAALLVVGCTTYRPLDGGSPVPWAQQVATPRLVAAAPERAGGAAKVVRAIQEVPAADLSGRVHRVERGEALIGIAQRYGVGPKQLAAANDIDPPYTIFAGQLLRIPPADAAPEATVVRTGTQPVQTTTVHHVQRGETLSGIARRYGVPSRRLAQMNGLAAPYAILAGQKLKIPANGEIRVARADPAEPAAPVVRTPATFEGDGFLWPVSGKIVGRFGRTEDGQRRDGIDIAARKGAPVRAAQDGVVVYAGDAMRGYGRMILLRHDDGYLTTYAQNSALLVNVGDQVERGQVIARMGDRLHFELRKGRKPVDPETLLVPPPTEVASSQ